MSDEQWKTIRIRLRVVHKTDALVAQNNGAGAVPSKTSRTDVIEAALEVYAQSLGITNLPLEEGPAWLISEPEALPSINSLKPRRKRRQT